MMTSQNKDGSTNEEKKEKNTIVNGLLFDPETNQILVVLVKDQKYALPGGKITAEFERNIFSNNLIELFEKRTSIKIRVQEQLMITNKPASNTVTFVVAAVNSKFPKILDSTGHITREEQRKYKALWMSIDKILKLPDESAEELKEVVKKFIERQDQPNDNNVISFVKKN